LCDPASGHARARASGPANDDAGTPPWPTYFSPAANNDDARPPSLPCRRRQHINSVTTFSHDI